MSRIPLVVILVGIGLVIWRRRNGPGFGEWLRRLSDLPTNGVLLGTAQFEREGRDPAKPA
jgi:hypothetical protein